MNLSPASTPLDTLSPAVAQPTAASAASKTKIHATAQDFESSFLQVMLGQMMSGAGQTDGTFSGGEGEQAFRSFLTEAMAKGVVKAGGIGVSQTVEHELLKLQTGGPRVSLHAQGPNDRAAQLLALTERLAERLAAETALFEARRPQDAAATLPATQELATLYRLESLRLRQEPSLLSGADPERLRALCAATERFEAVLARHGPAVHAAKVMTEGLVQAVAEEVARTRSAHAGYGPTARAARSDASAITLNARA